MPFRVLHVMKYFRPDFTGEGVFLERITPVMDVIDSDVQHEVLVVATRRPSQGMPHSSSIPRIYYLTSGPVSDMRRQLKLFAWMIFHLYRYRVVHYHTHVDRHFLTHVLLKLCRKTIIVSATLDDSVPGLVATYRPIWRWLVRRLFLILDAFV